MLGGGSCAGRVGRSTIGAVWESCAAERKVKGALSLVGSRSMSIGASVPWGGG